MSTQIPQLSVKGAAASVLRKRKFALVRAHGIPENLIGGSLAPTRRRCGKGNCRCRDGEGHPQWAVTLCRHGTKRVERVPVEWVCELEQAVLETQHYLEAVHEVMAINVELLACARAELRVRKVRGPQKRAALTQQAINSDGTSADQEAM
jgi:hypothetical protein